MLTLLMMEGGIRPLTFMEFKDRFSPSPTSSLVLVYLYYVEYYVHTEKQYDEIQYTWSVRHPAPLVPSFIVPGAQSLLSSLRALPDRHPFCQRPDRLTVPSHRHPMQVGVGTGGRCC